MHWQSGTALKLPQIKFSSKVPDYNKIKHKFKPLDRIRVPMAW
jgi:hypothetical protein